MLHDTASSFSRNTTEGFARRVRKNLAFIMDTRSKDADVHEVTQLAISLLGLIVFPWESGALGQLEHLSLSDGENEDWLKWTILSDKKGDTKTLGDLIRHLRNAASHRRIHFSSDDRALENVEITFEDAPGKDAKPDWQARINAKDLKVFCDRFTERLEEIVG